MATQVSKPQFNFDEIPDSSRLVLLSIIHREALDYLKQPGVAEKFAQWKAEKAARNKNMKAQEAQI